MKNRTALRAYFLSNSIPTEANFHELINSSLNQEEDGIRRAVNGPVELEAQGTAGEMLHLYGSFKDSAALWKIGHKPALAGAAGAAGLNIADAQASRLFIKAGDGSVGIGTDAPDRPLTVQAAGGNGEWLSLKATDGKTKFHLNNAGGGLNLAETGVADFRLFVKAGGNVGIGTSTPAAKLHLYGGGSELMFGSGGVSKASSIQVLDDGGFGGGLLFNVHAATGSDNWPTGMSTALAIRPNGNVGIGTSTPKATLQVVRGTAEYGTAVFEGTARYSHFNYSTAEDTYIRGGKATSNVYLNDNGGNVGIGTTSPNAKLDVNGDIFIGGRKPIIIRRFLNLRDNVYYNTNYPSATYAAAITGMNAKGGDINEGAADASSIIDCRMYIQQGTWWIRADFKTHNGNENWDIDVLFVDRRMAEVIDFG